MMNKDRRVDVGFCQIWTDDIGIVAIKYEDSAHIFMPEDQIMDMLKALSTWYLMGRTSEVVIKDE
jgi:hypothetical protein